MASAIGSDFWYVRLPDGRVLHAATTKVLRQEVVAGRVPAGSTVRRTPSEEWIAIEWARELSDLLERPRGAPPSGVEPGKHEAGRATTLADQLDPHRLRMVGVRGLLVELLAALDSALTAPKLLTTAVVAILIGIVVTVVQLGAVDFGSPFWDRFALWAAVLVLLCAPIGLLTQLTYLELAQLRQARWRQGLPGLGALLPRLIVTLGAVAATCWGLIVLVRWLPSQLVPSDGGLLGWLQQAAASTSLVAARAIEVALWAVLGVSALLPSLLVIEECSVVSAVRQWLLLLRDHLGRVFLFETLAIAIALLLSVPFALLLLPVATMAVDPQFPFATATACNLLGALAGALCVAYLIVANVFIYLHLRYHTHGR
jgi:hypothetical protein